MKPLLRFARPVAMVLAISAILSIVGGLAAIAPFYAVYQAVLTVTGLGDRPLMELALLALVGIMVQYVAAGISTALAHIAAYQVVAEVRGAGAAHLGRIPLTSVTRRRSGELKSLLVDDVERLEIFLAHAIPDMVGALTVTLALAVWLFYVDWRLALASYAVVVIAGWCMSRALSITKTAPAKYFAATAAMNGAIVEFIEGIEVLRGFRRVEVGLGTVEKAIRRQVETNAKYTHQTLPFTTSFYIFVTANAVTIAPVAAWLWQTGRIGSADVLFFAIVGLGANSMLARIFSLGGQFAVLIMSGASIRSLLDEPILPENERAATDTQLASVPGSPPALRFQNVTFGYDQDNPVVHDISFTARAGKVTALVGASGSGKSTLAALAVRANDPQQGRITVNEADLKSLSTTERTGTVVLMTQEARLFRGTIADNIRMARPKADDEQVRAAAASAVVTEFADHLPDGLDTSVGEGAMSLSGGEAQRVAIARAMLADTPIVVLDEATAFADPDTEALIQQGLAALALKRTLLVVAHRLGTVVSADHIVVLDAGRVVGEGTHDELLSMCKVYAQAWKDWTELHTLEDIS